MDKKTLWLICTVPVLIVLILIFLKSGKEEKMTDQANQSDSITEVTEKLASPSASEVKPEETREAEDSEQLNAEKDYHALLKTAKGDIKIKLNVDKTPKTAGNFITLSKKGFYDGLVFHRTIKDFMVQGGCPNGDGTGGPGYKFDDEPFEGEYLRGTVAMANSGPNTNGSQFFIMHKDYPLPPNYVIFGQVVEGIETVDTIVEAPTLPNASGENSTPTGPVVISSVSILEE